jgi:hypothetical protein
MITLNDDLVKTPLDEGSVRRKDFYLTIQYLQQTDSHATGGIRTRNPGKRTAANPRLSSCGHRDQANKSVVTNMATMRDFELLFDKFN